mgnify:CR=1 FL=1
MKRKFIYLVLAIFAFMLVGCKEVEKEPIIDTPQYTIVYVSDDKIIDSDFLTEDYELLIPEKEGYDFICWCLDRDGYVRIDLKKIQGSIIAYAKWELHKYYITFETNGGNRLEKVDVGNGLLPGELPKPVKEGFNFIGWFYDDKFNHSFDPNLPITEDTILYAKWEEQRFLVTFNANGGTISVPSLVVGYNQKINNLPTAEKVGHTFDGWYTDTYLTKKYDNGPVKSDLVLYAKYTPLKMTIKFADSAFPNMSVDYGKGISDLPVAVKADYTFVGWFLDNTLRNQYIPGTPITENITLYPSFTKNMCVIKFSTNGGTPVANATVTANSKFLTYTTTKIGYRFDGWYKESTFINKMNVGDTVETSMTLYAKWAPIEYTVTLNFCNPTYVNGDGELVTVTVSNKDDNKVVNYGELITVSSPSATGYIFEGWYTSSSYTTKFDFTKGITSSTTLYAKWKELRYTITFVTNGGSAIPPISVEAGGKLDTKPVTEKEGNVFRGWFLNRECTGTAWDWTSEITSDLTLYANWQEK